MSEVNNIVIDVPKEMMSKEEHINGMKAIKEAADYQNKVQKEYVIIWNILRKVLLDEPNNHAKACVLGGTLKELDDKMRPLTRWAILSYDKIIERKKDLDMVLEHLDSVGCTFIVKEEEQKIDSTRIRWFE